MFARSIVKSVKNIFVNSTAIMNNNLKLVKSAFFNGKVTNRHEKQDFIPLKNFPKFSVLNENYHFQAQPNPELLEKNNSTNKQNSCKMISSTKSTYVVSSFATATNTTSALTSTVMSTPCFLSTSTHSTSYSTTRSSRPRDNFSVPMVSPHNLINGLNAGSFPDSVPNMSNCHVPCSFMP